jgi:hypothetical protein
MFCMKVFGHIPSKLHMYCFSMFGHNRNSVRLTVCSPLLFHVVHSIYRRECFYILCWHQSVSCAINHRITADIIPCPVLSAIVSQLISFRVPCSQPSWHSWYQSVSRAISHHVTAVSTSQSSSYLYPPIFCQRLAVARRECPWEWRPQQDL